MSIVIQPSSIKLSITDNSIACEGMQKTGSITLSQACGDLSRATIRHVEQIKTYTNNYTAQKNKWSLVAAVIVIAALCIPEAIVACSVLALASFPAYKIYQLKTAHTGFIKFKGVDCALQYAQATDIIQEATRLLNEIAQSTSKGDQITTAVDYKQELELAASDLNIIKKQLPKAAADQAKTWGEYTRGLATYYLPV